VGYLTAFAYQYGYISHWNLPAQLVTVGLEQVLVASFVVGVGALAIIGLADPVVNMVASLGHPGQKRFAILFLLFATMSLWFLYIGVLWWTFLIPAVFMLLLLLPGLSWSRYSEQRWDWNRLVSAPTSPRGLVARILQSYGSGIYLTIFATVLLIIGANGVGNRAASHQEVFLYDASTSEVILTVNNDVALVAQVHGSRLTGSFRLESMTDTKASFTLTRLGHLGPPTPQHIHP
jgi:hypothetical protein